MISKPFRRRTCWLLPVLLLIAIPVPAGYKVRPWTPRAIESYPSKLTSEGVTIAVDPLITDALAGQVFDKNDMVARGIMPLAIIIFNSNDFPVAIEAAGIEVLQDDMKIQPVPPEEVAPRIYQGKTSRVAVPSPIPLPRIKITASNEDAAQDFQRKFLGIKKIEPHTTGGGFVFIPVTDPATLRSRLAPARVYIPDIYRTDTGADLIFFEIDLKAAVDAARKK